MTDCLRCWITSSMLSRALSRTSLVIILLIYAINAYGNTSLSGYQESLPTPSQLPQLRSGKHLFSFQENRVYLIGMGYALIEEFLGARSVFPIKDTTSSTSDLRRGKQSPIAGGVTYGDLWDGISVRYQTGVDGLVESIFTLLPDADPEDIRLRYNTAFDLEGDGALRFTLPNSKGWFSLTPPIAWQHIAGKKTMVDVSFKDCGDNILGYRLGSYNEHYPLMIDPTYEWHAFYGSDEGDEGIDIAIDADNSVFIVGSSRKSWKTYSNIEPLRPFNGGNIDICVIKLNADGIYQWHTFYGASNWDSGRAIAVDNNGNVFVAGQSNATWLGDNNEAPLHNHSGANDTTVIKLNSDGEYQWHAFYDDSSNVYENLTIATDMHGNLYLAGDYDASWLGDNSTDPLHAFSGLTEIAVMKLNTEGVYQWHTFLGSADRDYACTIFPDRSDNIIIGGAGTSPWQGTGNTDPIHPHSGGGMDITLLKLTGDGQYLWHTFYGGSQHDIAYDLSLTSNDDIIVSGISNETWKGDGQTEPLHPHQGSGDILVMKVTGEGQYLWHTFHGSSTRDYSYGITLDKREFIYVAGKSVDGWLGTETAPPLHPHSGASQYDITLLKLTPAGNYLFHTFYGPENSSDQGRGIAVDSKGGIYVVGMSTTGWLGDNGTAPLHPYSGLSDITVLKLKGGLFPWAMFLPAMSKISQE